MIPELFPASFDLLRLLDKDGKSLYDADGLALCVRNLMAMPEHGVGHLSEAISCSVRRQINGEYELQMSYPITGGCFDLLEERGIIMAKPDAKRDPQPFRIYRITKPMSGKVTVYARHLAYDLGGVVVKPFTADDIGSALSGLSSNAMTPMPFVFRTTRTTSARFAVKVPSTVWALMGGQQGSLLDVYGGEYDFNGRNITLENRVGVDGGVSIEYGVNLTDLEQDANCANCYTGAVGYWQMEDDVVYSPVVRATGNFGYEKIRTVDLSSKWEEKPTVEQVTAATAAFIAANHIGVPDVSWKISFVDLSQTEEYKHLTALYRVGLGDTVSVHFAKLGVDATARVAETIYNVLLDRYESITLGSARSNIASTIAEQSRALAATPTSTQVLSIAAQAAKVIMGAKGGSVRFLDTDGDGDPDTLYIADNSDPMLAVKVWRFNYEGWAASENGYSGPFKMGATLDNGLFADFITAGTMSANRIKGGTLTLGGENDVNGVIDIFDADGNYVGKFHRLGLWMGNGGLSTYHTPEMFDVRYKPGDTLLSVASITNAVSGGKRVGIITLANADSSGNRQVGAQISGNGSIILYNGGLYVRSVADDGTETSGVSIFANGTLQCKKLFVNGKEITG